MEKTLHDALVEALQALKEKPQRKGFSARVARVGNSPFVLTVLGGILLALVSGMITECTARNTTERELALERLRAKQSFVETFSSKLERYFELTLSVRKREIFLRGWQDDKDRPTIKYPDGRDFDQTRITWEAEKKYWLDQKTDSPIGLINAAAILFHDQTVRDELTKLSNAARRYGNATTYAALRAAYTDALDSLEKTAIAMADRVYEN
jgi:hypothetical protein